jgi:hypothetical protein
MKRYVKLLGLLLVHVTSNAQNIKSTDLNREYIFNDSLLWNRYEKKIDLIFSNTLNREEKKILLKALLENGVANLIDSTS